MWNFWGENILQFKKPLKAEKTSSYRFYWSLLMPHATWSSETKKREKERERL